MTQKSRRNKAAKRLKREARQGDQTFSFYKKNRIVEVVAHDLEEARAIFMQDHGFYPESTVQEVLK